MIHEQEQEQEHMKKYLRQKKKFPIVDRNAATAKAQGPPKKHVVVSRGKVSRFKTLVKGSWPPSPEWRRAGAAGCTG
jgi:hypothetical protein